MERNAAKIMLIVTVAMAGVAAYYFHRAYSLAEENANTILGGTPAANVAALVAKIGQLIVLPQNETPTVATVSDTSLLSGQPFFEGAAKGDIVLIYTGAEKAILYDPVANKVVAVAPITIGNSSSTSAATP